MQELNKPVENIVHKTDSRPFSLYHIFETYGEKNALYLHCHEEAEIFLLLAGEVEFIIENQTYRMVAGDAMFIPPNLIHQAKFTANVDSDCEFNAFVFDVDYFRRYLPPYCHAYFDALDGNRMDCICHIEAGEERNRKLLGGLRELFIHREEKMANCELSITGEVYMCWQELYNLYLSRLGKKNPGKQIHYELQKSIDYCHEHYAEQLTLSEIAGAAGLSESYFCRSFREYTGQPPIEYLNRIRIIRSCDYLEHTTKKITEVAMLSGFNNISYYNRVFQRIMGMRPNEYRRQSQ